MKVSSMEAINPSVNTTKEELQKRIDYMVNEASRLEELAKTDKYGAMKQFIVLKKFANNDYHILTLQKNEEAVNNNQYLLRYQGFFAHLHFTAGKIPLKLLHRNLDEFSQANLGFKL